MAALFRPRNNFGSQGRHAMPRWAFGQADVGQLPDKWVATGGLRWCHLQGGQRGSTPLLGTQLCLARPSPKAPRRARAAIPIRLCNLPDAFVSTTRPRRPPVRLHRGAHSPGAGKPAAQLVRTSRGTADTVWSCGIRIGFLWVGAEEKSPS